MNFKHFIFWLKWRIMENKKHYTCPIIELNFNHQMRLDYGNYIKRITGDFNPTLPFESYVMLKKKVSANESVKLAKKLRKVSMFDFFVLGKR